MSHEPWRGGRSPQSPPAGGPACSSPHFPDTDAALPRACPCSLQGTAGTRAPGVQRHSTGPEGDEGLAGAGGREGWGSPCAVPECPPGGTVLGDTAGLLWGLEDSEGETMEQGQVSHGREVTAEMASVTFLWSLDGGQGLPPVAARPRLQASPGLGTRWAVPASGPWHTLPLLPAVPTPHRGLPFTAQPGAAQPSSPLRPLVPSSTLDPPPDQPGHCTGWGGCKDPACLPPGLWSSARSGVQHVGPRRRALRLPLQAGAGASPASPLWVDPGYGRPAPRGASLRWR